MAKAVMGRNTKPSTLEYEPQPAMASEPKVLMLDCTTTLAMAMMEFCTPEGTPWEVIFFSRGRSKPMRLISSRYGPSDRVSLMMHRTALTTWLITVATAAPATPISMAPTNSRSRATLTTDEITR